jgi:hypothetical protein
MHFAFLSITILQWRRGKVWFSLLSNSRVTIFFRPLLSGPGVHLVGGATEGALYAGKQRNLSQLVD